MSSDREDLLNLEFAVGQYLMADGDEVSRWYEAVREAYSTLVYKRMERHYDYRKRQKYQISTD